MKAIETQYKGYRFRSRLEARWAVFFDALRLPWQYEPEGFELPSGRYLPDFFLPVQEYWIEIKGLEPSTRELKLAQDLADQTRQPVFVAVGLPDQEGWLHRPRGTTPRCAKLAWARTSPEAVAAAKSARFDHGESGAPMKLTPGYGDEFEALRKKGPQ